MATPESDPRASEIFELGEWTADPGLNVLTRGDLAVPVEPRVMEVLVYLASKPGQTVSKEELIAEVWRGAFVVDTVVAKSVSALRLALGDSVEDPRYIVTVPRRGYRLVARVQRGQPDAPPAPVVGADQSADAGPRRSRGWLAGSLVALGVLALGLPLSLDRRQRASGDGAEARRARIEPAIPADVERRFLEARLLWSRRGVDDLERAHRLFGEVVRDAPTFGDGFGYLALSHVTAANYGLSDHLQALEAAEAAARQALALAPESAVSHTAAGLVAIELHRDARRAIAAYDRAVAADPTFAPARQFLAEALSASGRHAEAMEQARAARELEPLSALMNGVEGLVLDAAGHPHQALIAIDRALVLDPRFVWMLVYRARSLIRLGREQEAAEVLLERLRHFNSDRGDMARWEDAVANDGLAGYWSQILAEAERGRVPRHIEVAEALGALGRGEEALEQLQLSASEDEAEYFLHYRASPAFDDIRADPRFVALYRGLGL